MSAAGSAGARLKKIGLKRSAGSYQLFNRNVSCVGGTTDLRVPAKDLELAITLKRDLRVHHRLGVFWILGCNLIRAGFQPPLRRGKPG